MEPKRSRMGSKMASKNVRKSEVARHGSQRAASEPQGTILEQFWCHFGPMSVPFWTHFDVISDQLWTFPSSSCATSCIYVSLFTLTENSHPFLTTYPQVHEPWCFWLLFLIDLLMVFWSMLGSIWAQFRVHARLPVFTFPHSRWLKIHIPSQPLIHKYTNWVGGIREAQTINWGYQMSLETK